MDVYLFSNFTKCVYIVEILPQWKIKGLFGFASLITHHSVFITHNSKLVGPMERKSVWLCFQDLFPSLNSLIFE